MIPIFYKLKNPKKVLKIAFAIMFFYVGMPCIYYGDEVGMEGGYDPGCRGGFPWDSTKWDHELRKAVQQLCLLKTSGKLSGDEIQIQSILKSRDQWTVAVGLYSMPETHFSRFAAGSVFIAVPIVILYFFLVKHIVSGLTAGAVKG